MSNIKYLTLPMHMTKAELSEEGGIQGYASLFDIEDTGSDIVMPGAFTKTLREGSPWGAVKMLYQHDRREPIGLWPDLKEDNLGLNATGQIDTELFQGQQSYIRVKNKLIDGLSIGYRVIRDEWDRVLEVRKLIEIQLLEISLVTFAMLPTARIDAVKSGKITEREFEDILVRDVGLSQREAKTLMSGGFKTMLANKRDVAAHGQEVSDITDAFNSFKLKRTTP